MIDDRWWPCVVVVHARGLQVAAARAYAAQRWAGRSFRTATVAAASLDRFALSGPPSAAVVVASVAVVH